MPTTPQNRSRFKRYFRLDTADARLKKLCDSAARVSALLASKSQGRDDVFATLDDLLGALYALIFALELDFQDRINNPIERGPVITRAGEIAQGDVRLDGAWMAGFMFNGALFRIAAVYHRSLKIMSGQDKNIGQLLQCLGIAHKVKNLEEIRKEVNPLKHEIQGIYPARRATFDHALDSIDEVLSLLESWKPSLKTSSDKP